MVKRISKPLSKELANAVANRNDMRSSPFQVPKEVYPLGYPSAKSWSSLHPNPAPRPARYANRKMGIGDT